MTDGEEPGPFGLAAALRRGGRSAALRAFVTLALLGALFAWLPRDELVGALRRVGPGLWLGVLAGFAAGHILAAGKWRLLLGGVGLRPGAVAVLRAHGAGLFANLCLPSLVGGDVVRAGVIAGDGRKLAPVAVAGLADRLVDTTALLLLAATAAVIAPTEASRAGSLLAGVAVALLLGVVAALLGLRVLDAARLPARARDVVVKVREATEELRSRPRLAVAALGLSLAVQGGFVLLNVRLGAAIGIDVALSVWFLVWPLAKLAALLPVSLGGIGVREAALAGMMAPLGVAPALAVAQMLVWESVLIALGAFAGLAFLLSGRWLRADARALS